jgi:hypothetical protein
MRVCACVGVIWVPGNSVIVCAELERRCEAVREGNERFCARVGNLPRPSCSDPHKTIQKQKQEYFTKS